MPKQCLKCGHINPAAADAQLLECPECKVIYAKFEAVVAKKAQDLNVSVEDYVYSLRQAELKRKQSFEETKLKAQTLPPVPAEVQPPSVIPIATPTPAPAAKPPVVVKAYKGNQDTATRVFQADATAMAVQGYVPTSQNWAPGAYGCGAFIGALFLCIVLIGIVIFIYMLLVKPEGTLAVTYELRDVALATPTSVTSAAEKTCPMCAEQVKAAAQVCRYCGHTFELK